MNNTVERTRFEKVMVIDDDDMDIYITNRVLESTSFAKQIVIETSVSDALEYIKDTVSNSGMLPDVIFLDLNFPGKNGFDFLKEYKLICEKVKATSHIIILTNSLNEDFEQSFIIRNHPMVHSVFYKPLTPEMLGQI